MTKNLITTISEYFSEHKTIETIVLAGSSTALIKDDLSDLDFYIYSNSEIPSDYRKKLITKISQNYEINNQFWETGDEAVINTQELNNSDNKTITIDIMYRHINWLEEQIDRVYNKNQASVGYSTCFLHNIATSKILFDRNNWFSSFQNQINTQYPEDLKQNIISKNYPILRNNISSYYFQIKKALIRNDFVSVNHRITALLASYFDILFAFNKVYHPGEKKLLQYVEQTCKYKPDNYKLDVERILKQNKETLLQDIQTLLDNLDILIK